LLARLLIVAAAAIPASAVASPASHFVKDAIQGDYSEMTLGKLIQQRGNTSQVREFGAMLAKDHREGLDQAEQLAKKLHLNIQPSMMPEAKVELSKLQRLRGHAFDLEVKRYMVHDHVNDLAEFKKQAKSGDRATASFAAATVPVLQKHLNAARSIKA
jgi:putative membrane protein